MDKMDKENFLIVKKDEEGHLLNFRKLHTRDSFPSSSSHQKKLLTIKRAKYSKFG